LGFLARILVVAVALVGAAALIGTYTFLAPILERTVGRNVQDNLGLDARPEVELASDPPPKMLVGEFSGGRVAMGGFDLGDVRPDRVTVDLDPFEVNVLGSAREGAVRTETPLSGRMNVELSEENVTGIARSRVRDFTVQSVDLEPGRATVSSEVEVLGFPVPTSVEGGLEVRDGALVFEPRTVRAFRTPLPEDLADSLLAGTDFTYPIEGLPYDTRITDVEVQKGRLLLSGDVEGITLGETGG
jgi:hypothetical protein